MSRDTAIATYPSIIERLPEELRFQCLSYCDSNAILKLILASKGVYDLCINYLLHHIDLSFHNDEILRTHSTYTNITVPPDYIKARPLQPSDGRLLERQHHLLDQLNEQRHLGLQTRVLRWTLFDPPVYDGQEGFDWKDNTFNHGTYALWGAFMCFSKLTEIDLAFMTGSREWDPLPPSLFATATSVSLAGIASYEVISTILTSINPSKLLHLRFNNLQTFRKSETELTASNAPNVQSHRRTRHGAAQGFLADLTGRCTSLRTFHLLTTAEYYDLSTAGVFRPNLRWPISVADESRRYAEIGAFIESVKPTLRELVFEHGPDVEYYSTVKGQAYGQAPDVPLPMDTYFDTYVLPVLVSGPWPRLTSVAIRGIGHWKPLDAWREEATDAEVDWLHAKTADFRNKAIMIWEAVSAGCEVVVEDEASRPFYRFQDDGTVNGKGGP